MPSSSPPWIIFSTSFVSDFNLSSTSITFSFLDLSPMSLSPLESFALSSSFMFSCFFAGFSICKIFSPHHFHHLKYLQHELPIEKFFHLVNLNLLANLHMMYCPIQLQHPPQESHVVVYYLHCPNVLSFYVYPAWLFHWT